MMSFCLGPLGFYSSLPEKEKLSFFYKLSESSLVFAVSLGTVELAK